MIGFGQAAAQVGEALEKRVLTGGCLEALHRSSENRRQAWARSYLNAILQLDVRDIASVDYQGGRVEVVANGPRPHGGKVPMRSLAGLQTKRKLPVVKVGKRALAEAVSEGKAGLNRFRLTMSVAAATPMPSASKRRSPVVWL